jgi:hypothetical protein
MSYQIPNINFQYQQLQYCPQRNVESISKEKMFVSTVSKYDPRTKRTTRLQNCVDYKDLLAKEYLICKSCPGQYPPYVYVQGGLPD